MNFGEKLAAARKEKNLSQEELAQKIYVTRQAVSRWENNSAQPSLEMLAALCAALGKTPNDFIEVGQGKNFTFYKTLSFKQKYCLALEWRGVNKWTQVLIFISNLILCAGVGLTTYFAAAQRYNKFSTGLFVSCLFGSAVLLLAGVILYVLTYVNARIKYNLWLLQAKSIVRKRK